MNIFKKYTAIVVAALAVSAGMSLTSCDNDDIDTNQFASKGVHLNVFGPTPVARGGELRFLGSGLDQVRSVSIPGCADITDIKVTSQQEIRITVPQEAEPGLVILHTPSGDIVTKTPITYLEPISLETVSPLKVKAGDVLTLRGEYLNLIKEVCFPFAEDSVNVFADDFITHTRQEITLTVPAGAVSGKIIISDAAELPNQIYADDDLDVALPAVGAPLDLNNVRPGSTVTVKVSDIDLVKAVELPNGTQVDFSVNNDELSFMLPTDMTDGAVEMVALSGIRITIANVVVVVPTDLVVTPADGLRAGSEITVKGSDIDQVVSIVFPNAGEAVEPSAISASELKVNMPAIAQTGEMVLNLHSGKSVSVWIATAKPGDIAYASNSIPSGNQLKITGSNLDLVVSMVFGGDVTVDIVNDNASELEVTVPNTARTGEIIFNMANGESVTGPALTVEAPECAYIIAFPEGKYIQGEIVEFTVVNGDKLSDVTFAGERVQYLLDGDVMRLKVPVTIHGTCTLLLTSTNGSISYDLEVISADELERVIWEGSWSNAGWGGNQDLAWGGFDWSTVAAGQTLTVYGTLDSGSWGCISLRHGNGWGNLPDPCPGQFDFNPSTTSCSLVLTAEILQDIIDNGGLVITGDNITITKVTVL